MSAPPLLLVPGTLCDGRVFGPVLDRLGPSARAAPPIEHATVGEAADALLASAPDRFVAGGFSLGGFVVLELLRRAPDRLAGAVLIASHPLPPAADQAEARRREVALSRRAGMGAVIDGLWPRYVARRRLGDVALRRLVVDMAEAVGPDRFEAQAELAIARPDGRAAVRAATTPILAICGADDVMCPPDRCCAVSGPTVRSTMLPDVGHFIPLEAADACADAIGAWMGGLGPCC